MELIKKEKLAYKLLNLKIKLFQSRGLNSGGYTLIELLIAFTLFVTILGVLTSIFLISNRTQRNISELVLVNDNTYLAIEQMARDIRDGKDFDFTCGASCFSFYNRNGEQIIYDYLNGSIRITNVSRAQGPDNLTASNVNVVSFGVTPNNCLDIPSDDSTAPVRITLNLEIRPRNAPNNEAFVNYIQTTVANRNLSTCTL